MLSGPVAELLSNRAGGYLRKYAGIIVLAISRFESGLLVGYRLLLGSDTGPGDYRDTSGHFAELFCPVFPVAVPQFPLRAVATGYRPAASITRSSSTQSSVN